MHQTQETVILSDICIFKVINLGKLLGKILKILGELKHVCMLFKIVK